MTSRHSTSLDSGSRAMSTAVDGGAKGKGKKVDVKASLQRERERLVHERQESVTRVLDEHDDLIREAFHMEKFVTMLAYDPKTAKEDNSAVFHQYKARFDLLEQTAPAGPSRSTRSAHSARLGALKAAPSPVAAKPKRRPQPPKQNASDSSFWAIMSEAKARDKGKMKASLDQDEFEPIEQTESDARVSAASESISAARPLPGRQIRKRAQIESPLPYPGLGEPPPMKKRKLGPSLSTPNLPPPTKTPRQKTKASLVESPSIRRIKLIVRRPDPSFTHPAQKPSPTRYGGSLTQLLTSFATPDEDDDDEAFVPDDLVRERAAFLNKVASLQKQGRLLISSDEKQVEPERAGGDLWDHILQDVESGVRPRSLTSRQAAAQVANRVKAYWESQAAKEDKFKAQEEKRLRALAKATIKMVVTKWKEAVLHIREEERQKAIEEERKRGHEHLDDILSRSGRILEAQQAELGKTDLVTSSRSQSSSLVSTPLPWTTSPNGSDDEETNSVTNDNDVEQDSDNDDNADTAGLLVSSPTATPAPDGTLSSRSSLVPPDSPTSHSVTPSHDSLELLAYPKDTDMSSPIDLQHPPELKLSNPFLETVSEHFPNDALGIKEILRRRTSPATEPPSTLDEPRASSPAPTETTYSAVTPGEIPEHRDAEPQDDEASNDTPITSRLQRRPAEDADSDDDSDIQDDELLASIPAYLRPYAVAPVEWDAQRKVAPPLLLRGTLRPYQQAGLEWLANIHVNNLNGILADEMGLGKTIQTIALLAHLACDRGIWGPHLIIVPTSVLLNWEMEFKKFLPGFKVLSYHGNTKRRKELRQGWNNKYNFNVCVTSYALASRDAHVFKRKPWYYMILDEAHMIKNFKSQRWNTLLMFRSFRRLLLTGTPLQNNLTELWALLQFLMSGTNFANLKEFADWFSNPLEKAIEMGTTLDDENQQRVSKLHTVLRPYLLRRLKRDVEKELPSKFEHIVMCPLSKRQRFLYDEFMSRAETRNDLQSGVYQKIANILMQLRKVVNHPDLFEVRPIRTSFAMDRSAIADFEIKELLIRREFLRQSPENQVNLGLFGLRFIDQQNVSELAALETRRLDATRLLPCFSEDLGDPPPYDTRTIAGFRKMRAFQERAALIARWDQTGYLNHLRCRRIPLYGHELISLVSQCTRPLLPIEEVDLNRGYMDIVQNIPKAIKSYSTRSVELSGLIDRFAFATPAAITRDLARIALAGHEDLLRDKIGDTNFDQVLHRSAVKLQIAFPDPSLLQYDCGKLQKLVELLRERSAGGHRVLIFTQMTRILDILEIFLNFHGYLYLRLDGATKIEDRQYITERFNSDSRIFCFISSSRSGGVGINLTGADTVIFYDSDFNPQMDRQCEDRAHRIGQIRDVHIYRFISQHTVEEALLRKANQKRYLDNVVIQQGEFDWRSLVNMKDEHALSRALVEFEDAEDARAAALAASEEVAIEGADEDDFEWEGATQPTANEEDIGLVEDDAKQIPARAPSVSSAGQELNAEEEDADEDEDGGTTVEYMLSFIRSDMEFFENWRI